MRDGVLNELYLQFIRKQPCCVCGSRKGIEAAHFGPHGLSIKAPDKDALPLCHLHHKDSNESYHSLGPVDFAELHGLNVPTLIAKFNELGKRLLDMAHRPGRLKRSRRFFRRFCTCGWKSGWFKTPDGAKESLDYHLDRREAA